MTETAAPELEWVTDPRTGVSLALVPGWERVDAPPAALTIAAAGWDEARGFRPNVNVMVAPVDAEDVMELGTAAIANVIATLEDAHVVAYDLWMGPDVTEEPRGRMLTFAYPQDTSTVVVRQWFALVDGLGYTVTASCGMELYPSYGPAQDEIGGAVRLPSWRP